MGRGRGFNTESTEGAESMEGMEGAEKTGELGRRRAVAQASPSERAEESAPRQSRVRPPTRQLGWNRAGLQHDPPKVN